MTGSHKDVEELFETTSVDEIRVILTGAAHFESDLCLLQFTVNLHVGLQVWNVRWTAKEKSFGLLLVSDTVT